jgi:hypothetical protein
MPLLLKDHLPIIGTNALFCIVIFCPVGKVYAALFA